MKFKKELATVRRRCCEAKTTTFRNFLEGILHTGTFKALYPLITDRLYMSGKSVEIRRTGCSLTESNKESVFEILKFHFPTVGSIREFDTETGLTFPRFTEIEIGGILKEFGIDKAPGIDGLTGGIFKELFNCNQDLMVHIFNDCLKRSFSKSLERGSSGVEPKRCGKDNSQPSGYRPICLLPVWGKVLDKILAKRLSFHLESRGKLHEYQFDFRKGKSTNSALYEVLETINRNKSQNWITAMVSLDVSNAFNSIHWDDIVALLYEDGVPEYLINLTKSFLSRRRIIDEENDILQDYNIGVPQGSCLSPILWLTVADKLLREMNSITGVKIVMFADGIRLLFAENASYRFTNTTIDALEKTENWAKN